MTLDAFIINRCFSRPKQDVLSGLFSKIWAFLTKGHRFVNITTHEIYLDE